jgi:AraC-like DNA-binding protein
VNFVSIPPTPPLAQFVERFWYSSDAPRHRKVRVVPSGTIELVFNLDEDELGFHKTDQLGNCQNFSGAIFSGTHVQPLFVDTRKHVMGVHFKPGGAFRFLGIPASELTGTHVDLELLWGSSAQDLREQLCAAANPAQHFRVLQDALVARLKDAVEVHRAVRVALEIFGRDADEAKTRDLAARLGLSQRHFIKSFSNQVGVTPKVYARVQRFQHAVNLARSSSTPHWAEIAAACGYFDQSHLIHDFQTFSGLSPTEFQRQRSVGLLTSAPIAE